MDLDIHGVNNFKFSNYSLATQIIIINLSTDFLSLIFIIIFNIFLLSNNKSLENHKKIFNLQLNEITTYLSQNAIKRIMTFDDTCNRILKESDINCSTNNFLDKNYEDKKPQLDPTYTQRYIYSNFLKSKIIVKVFADNWIKFADTADFYSDQEDILILEIDSKATNKYEKKSEFYLFYKKVYFNIYNLFQKYLDEKKLNKLKNDNITIMETIKSKKSTSYMFKDENKKFKSIFASPILKDNKVYGVVLIITPFNYDDNSAYQSMLLTNFFLFFISIMFFLSFLFSKSIVNPIKILSHNTRLELDKTINKKNMIEYPSRKDEIGDLSLDIRSMSNDLKKRIRDIEEFASDVSHELKNPLAGLKSSSDLLRTKKLDLKKSEILINNMSTDIDRMNFLISDISNYSLTQVEISEEAFEEVELINFLDRFKKSLPYKKNVLEIKNLTNEILININTNKFLQVLHNLIDNSLSYIEKNSKILMTVQAIDKYCIINLVDQGPGIPLKYKEKIFDRFYTDREKNRNAHSGLGLSISKKIIESFGGSINLVKSTNLSFQGACFEIKLPLKD